MLYGVIDIGSSTVRMAVYDISPAGGAEMLLKKKHIVGLAGYVKDGRMTQAGIEKTVEILLEFRSFLACFHIDHVRAFTTAALRNASNSREAVAEIERRTGLSIRVISGDEEATFDFIGATHGLAGERGLLVDIGGGSTELVAFAGGRIEQKVSLAMGATAFHARFSAEVLPSRAECAAMRAAAQEVLAGAVSFARVKAPAICGIGGTFKSGLALYRAVYGGDAADDLTMEAARLSALIERFVRDRALPQEDVVRLMRAVPDRLPTILPGLVIASVIAEQFGTQRITYSDSGVREGFIYSEIIGGGAASFPCPQR
ncbi:hypothetical protein [Selenomonas bovis]|uniref:Ppx/GppA phosphatase family protein n=1 Tax=Selenomonas bovis TaxID=416586 RepID=UPI0003819E62|nr:hypothetical protein [Selenomonas bovis]MCI6170799.1 exopolyphosphatase [Selenomonas bovis]